MKDDVSAISFPVSVARLPRTGTPVWLEADEQQRAALAAGHGLLSVERLRVDATIVPWQRGGVKVAGVVSATITQACIVSLEPVAATVDEAFEAVLVPEGSRLARPGRTDSGEILVDADGPDMPETFSGDHVDVGALAEEFFELAIDPYPRAPGAELAAVAAGEAGGETDGEAGTNPFREKLSRLAGKS